MSGSELEVSVEQEVPDPAGGPPRRIRLSTRVGATDGSGSDRTGAIAAAIDELTRVLDGTLGTSTGGPTPGVSQPRPDRTFDELVEAYHPRQAELVDLLRDEGQLTVGEHAMLQRYLTTPTAAAVPPPPAPAARSIAEAPLERDRTPSAPRPVEQLLSQYQIASLKQAGAVRARRQISYEEYMALKRHFAAEERPPAPGPSG
ncbi:MAG TPA: hypothetical protein VFF67_00495 [Thermoplasmata archaeon]|nr:hypothetical protein [Thermoplasmata archaeon]